jgi:hypothetical protein
VASAGRTVDVSFGGLIEYLNKVHTINAGSPDPVLFIFPLYAFKGGALVTFNPKVPNLTQLAADRPNVEELATEWDSPSTASFTCWLHTLPARSESPLKR